MRYCNHPSGCDSFCPPAFFLYGRRVMPRPFTMRHAAAISIVELIPYKSQIISFPIPQNSTYAVATSETG